jgi:hypothetical protein
MPTKCARYHGYALDIFGPNGEAGRWKVHVWPPSRKPPIIVPAQASEDDAMTVAKIIIDYLLVSSRQPEKARSQGASPAVDWLAVGARMGSAVMDRTLPVRVNRAQVLTLWAPWSPNG